MVKLKTFFKIYAFATSEPGRLRKNTSSGDLLADGEAVPGLAQDFGEVERARRARGEGGAKGAIQVSTRRTGSSPRAASTVSLPPTRNRQGV